MVNSWFHMADRGMRIAARSLMVVLFVLTSASVAPGLVIASSTDQPTTQAVTQDYQVFVPYIQRSRATPSPTPSPTQPTPDDAWTSVASWVYQLTNYRDGRLDEIAATAFDLAVIDLARDGRSDFFTRSEIEALQATGKVVLAYFEIGAIESYRPEWDDVPDELKLGAVSGWPSEQYVAYWDARWWPIVQGRVDQALAAGFDGAYLDMIVTYEEIAADAAGTNRSDLARKMVDLIARLSAYAKMRDPDFKIVPQNSPELYTYAGYLDAIDGLGMEELYFLATDRPCTRSWCDENRQNAAAVAAADKLVLTVDYATQQVNIDSAYEQSLAAGFVPYVSVVSLNIVRLNTGWDPLPTATPAPSPTATGTPSPTTTTTATPTATATSTPSPTATPTPSPTTTATATPTATPSSTPTNTPTPTPPAGDGGWEAVDSWVYQLTGYRDGKLDEIAATAFDLAVIDLARDGRTGYFTRSEIAALQATDKVALAYFEIGAIEDYRPEWEDVPDELKLGSVSGWPGEQYVAYWDARWWPIVQGRVDQALAAGFDGAYLDMIVTYEEIPADAAGTNRADLARKMVDLIARLSAYAKQHDPDFKVVPQNSPELSTYAGYLEAIDGLGMEELYFLATDTACTQSWCSYNRQSAAAVASAGKLVLTIDYANIQANIDSAYEQSLAAGFVPYVSVRSLNVARINPGWEP